MAGTHNNLQNSDIFYFHTLNLTFKSAQTLQVVKDYYYLSRHGYNIHIYGVYRDRDDLEDVLKYIDGAFCLYYKEDSIYGRLIVKLRLLRDIILSDNLKLIVTRHYKKAKEIIFIRPLLKHQKIILEMHEEAIPHLVNGKKGSKSKFLSVVRQMDAVIFTNFSQRKIFLDEFGCLPQNNIVLPNGVEIDKFRKAQKGRNFVITYLGQFNRWKNVELVFKAMAFLDGKYRLRIAGGKGDEASRRFIDDLTDRYHLQGRVDYMGFVRNDEAVSRVLDDSNVLVLPLGDNIQSRYLTSPMKLFEYMATAIPVVAVNYPSISMLVSDREIYLADNNAEDFADKIREAAVGENGDRIRRMNALAWKYSYEARSDRYHKFITNLLGIKK